MLTNNEIRKQMALGNIIVKDAKENPLKKPNSFDLRLGEYLYTFDYDILDVKNGKKYLQEVITDNIDTLKRQKIGEKGILLQPHKVYLAKTIEYVKTNGFIPVLYGKANMSLLGLSIELTNGYKNSNFEGQFLLSIIATKPTIIYPGIDIANLGFFPSLNKSNELRQIRESVDCGLYTSGMLSGEEIKERMLGENPDIIINKPDLVVFNPNSVNLTLHNTIGIYTEPYLDIKEKNCVEKVLIPETGCILYPDEVYVARTNEWTETNNLIPMLGGRSSLGRNGIHVHCSAGFGGIGYKGYWHLGIRVVKPILVKNNMKCCQLYYLTPEGEITNTYNETMQNISSDECGSQMHLIMKRKV